MTEQRLPPVAHVALVSGALIVAGGIYMASALPGDVSLGPVVFLLVASAALVTSNVIALTRVPDFNWPIFLRVAKWALLAQLVVAGLIDYVVIRNGMRGAELIVLTLSLIVYASHVPLLMGFTVARYQPLTKPPRR